MSPTRTWTLLRVDGTREEVTPANGWQFLLRELQALVGGMIEIQRLPKTGGIIVMHEEGKLLDLPVNAQASALWRENYPLDEYPYNNDGLIVGPVAIGPVL